MFGIISPWLSVHAVLCAWEDTCICHDSTVQKEQLQETFKDFPTKHYLLSSWKPLSSYNVGYIFLLETFQNIELLICVCFASP